MKNTEPEYLQNRANYNLREYRRAQLLFALTIWTALFAIIVLVICFSL